MTNQIQVLADLAKKSVPHGLTPDKWIEVYNQKFAELMVKECVGVIHLESKDFVNGNCFADNALWKSVTTEYGKNRERGFDPIGMSIHFEKILKKHFGVDE